MSVEDENARLREELAAVRARLRAAEQVAPACFAFLSLEGEVLEVSELALRVIGARAEDVIGTFFWEAPWWRSVPTSAARIREAVADASRGRASRLDLEFLAHAPGDPAGTTRWAALEIKPACDGGDRHERIVATAFDITDRTRSASALVLEHNVLEALFEQSPGAMVLWRGDDMVFEMVNPAYQVFFPGRQLLGRPLLEACPELADQPFPQLIRNVLATGEPYVGREELARLADADGTLRDRYYDFTYVRVDDAEGKPYGVYDHAIEVTDRVRARTALEASRAELEATVGDLREERTLRERFVAALTHDLRTPLTVAKLGAFALARSSGDTPHATTIARRIARSVDRAEAMIRDLLDVSAIKAGERVALDVVECDLNAIAESTIDELTSIHGERFVLDAERIRGHWDCSAIRRIVENLAGNAVKYGSVGAPIAISLSRHGAEVSIAVHNEGEPIAQEDHTRVFEAFQRTGPAIESASVGWGIGLMLVKALAEAHGGRVEVASAEGTGTTFSVWRPLDASAANASHLGG